MAEHSSEGLGPAATLSDALAAWRADRSSVALANAVDAVAVPQLSPPAKVHGWWMELARDYDPVLATTLLATLELQARGGDGRRLLERVGALLAWPPDDPRVALALAHRARQRPFSDDRRYRARDPAMAPILGDIARWVIASGDLRALGRIGNLRPRFTDDVREAVAQALERAPAPRTTEPSLPAAWQAVLDEPFALAPRLVLADAYLERGDPRGELIAMQCAPLAAIEEARRAGRTLDAHGLFGRNQARIGALLRTYWYRWFGEVSPVVAEKSALKGGLLSRVAVGRDRTPTWAWTFAARHRELCAVEDISAMHRVDPSGYAELVGALPRPARWVYLNDDLLRAFRTPVALVGIKYRVERRPPLEVAHALVAIAPGLQRLRFRYDYLQHMDAIHEVITQFPHINVELAT